VRSWPLDPFDEYVADGLGRDRIDEIADDDVPVVDRLAAPAHEHRVGVVLLDRVEDRFVDVVSDLTVPLIGIVFPTASLASFPFSTAVGAVSVSGAAVPGFAPPSEAIDDLALLVDVLLAV
jgi:hypothetical protein